MVLSCPVLSCFILPCLFLLCLVSCGGSVSAVLLLLFVLHYVVIAYNVEVRVVQRCLHKRGAIKKQDNCSYVILAIHYVSCYPLGLAFFWHTNTLFTAQDISLTVKRINKKKEKARFCSNNELRRQQRRNRASNYVCYI